MLVGPLGKEDKRQDTDKKTEKKKNLFVIMGLAGDDFHGAALFTK